MSVDIINSTDPSPGQSLTLRCRISGAENLNPRLLYHWTKDNGTLTDVGDNSSTLLLHSLRLSDRGEYTCTVAVASVYLLDTIDVSSRPYEVQIPSKLLKLSTFIIL